MQGVTLAIAALAVVGVLALPIRYSVPIYLAALAWYPSYLAVSIGTVDFTVSRIVILAVLARLLVDREGVAHFRWGWVDTFVVLALAGEYVAGLMTTPTGRLLENRAGAAFDTMLPYFAVRLAVRTKEDYRALLWSLVVIAAPLALFGAYQCWTGDNPFGFLRRFRFTGAVTSGRVLPGRRGFWRAEVTFPMSIMFGLFFAMMGPICAGLWGYTKRKGLLIAGLGLMLVGMLSSVSSGPWLAGIVACGVMAFYPLRRYWKVALVLIVLFLAAIDVASNRRWYHVLASYSTLDAGTAYYRIGLMEEALGGGMSGHWLAGYGMVGRGGTQSFNWKHKDIVNHYILILVRYGLLALVPFVAAVTAGFFQLRRALARAVQENARWLVWTVMAALVGILAAMFSVSLFGQPGNLFYILLALAAGMPVLVTEGGQQKVRATGMVDFMIPAHSVVRQMFPESDA
jgi:hypothetical protein